MSEIAISARSVGKSYTIRHNARRSTTLGEALGSVIRHGIQRSRRETFQALDDVSFEVARGEVVGIIGHNGAGKSTLLKILSQITSPTRGEVDLHGRVGSLLEVGTGFHPELTGRENIFLNGAILGMRRGEIVGKLDEIVAFAEVENFLDTPVKRYSSGMYVRLAFAVAAHLEPEILLVDEVLAVGDVQFQQRCLGKMNEVSAKEGRTILFVSHNLAAMRTLCSRALLLARGRMVMDGPVDEVVESYLEPLAGQNVEVEWSGKNAVGSAEFDFTFLRAWIENQNGVMASNLQQDQPFVICVEYEVGRHLPGLRIGFYMENAHGVGMCGSNDVEEPQASERKPGRYVNRCSFPAGVLNEGNYRVQFGADTYGREGAEYLCLVTPFSLGFSIEDLERHHAGRQKLPGVIRVPIGWNIEPARKTKAAINHAQNIP